MVLDAQRLQVENARKRVLGLACEAVTNCVLPALGAADSAFELTLPRYGLSSLIFLVDVSNGPSFALRVEPRWKRYVDFRRRRRATQFWNRHALPTPRILYHDLSVRTRLQTGLFLLAEEKIDGGNVVDFDAGSGAYEAMGRALAQVHSFTRRWHHGAFFRPKIGSYTAHFMRRNLKRLHTLAVSGAVSDRERVQLTRFLEQFKPDLQALRAFNMIHRRCTESDLLFDTSGQGWVLEPYRAGFGVFVVDLVRAELRVCREEKEKIERFHQAYFAAAPAESGPLYERLAPAFRAELHLAHAVRWAQDQTRDAATASRALESELERLRRVSGL